MLTEETIGITSSDELLRDIVAGTYIYAGTKAVDVETLKDETSAENLDEEDLNELMDTIKAYYKKQYGTNNVAAEIDKVDQKIIMISLYDPNATNVTPNYLGFYSYNIETKVWLDEITREEIDINGLTDGETDGEG